MWVNDEKQAYKYQFLNAFILVISSAFFFSWTGVVTMAIAATRNLMVYYDKLTFKWTIFFIIITSNIFRHTDSSIVNSLFICQNSIKIRISDYSKTSYKRIVNEGHTLANHTATHDFETVYGSLEGFEEEVMTLHNNIKNLTGYEMKIFRFQYRRKIPDEVHFFPEMASDGGKERRQVPVFIHFQLHFPK